MSVRFYPEKSINHLESIITKKDGSPLYGEIEIYKQLFYSCTKSEKEFHIWHDLRIPFHSSNSNPKNKSEAQLDFLVLCDQGIIIIEVKGGKIFYSNRRFYSDRELDVPLHQNPIDQVNGYKITLVEEALSLDKRIFITCCIAFPHSTFSVESEIIDSSIFWSKSNFEKFTRDDSIPDISKFILTVFEAKKKKMSMHKRHFGKINSELINKAIRFFNPQSIPLNNQLFPSTLAWLKIENLDLYNCIKSNRMIMVEGGPGTGKTTFAMAFIDERRDRNGLFICWNKLLKAKIKKKLYYRNLNKCDVLGFASVDLSKLQNLAKKKYDYIVIDEGQDLFERGIDQFINTVIESGSGLTYGNVLLLYDIDQSYSSKSTDIRDYEFLLREYFSHFKLKDNRRSAQVPSIKKIANEIIDARLSSLHEFEKSEGVIITTFSSKKKLFHYIRNSIQPKLKNNNEESFGANSIMLIESELFNTTQSKNGLDVELIDFSNLEELNEHNVGIQDNILRYTTPLKFKGLESKFVFLICRDINEFNFYELYVGITRSIFQIQILLIDEG